MHTATPLSSLSLALMLLLALCGASAACHDLDPVEQGATPDVVQRERQIEALRADLLAQGVEPLRKPEISAQKAELGKMLFFDSILSGTKDTSCGTCHRPMQATVDGVSLPAGSLARHDPLTGARTPGSEQNYMPRNVPDLFNRGDALFTSFFWDKNIQSVEIDGQMQFAIFERMDRRAPQNFFRVLSGQGFEATMMASPENLLAAQNMMPVLNRDELRGPSGSVDVCGEPNELASVPDSNPETVWKRLMARLLEHEAYRELFRAAYPEVPEERLSFVHAANGLSAFISDAYTLTDSPWDRFLEGEDEALTDEALRGATLFYGKAQCSSCHSGTMMTDLKPYNLGVTPLGHGPSSRQTTTRKLDRGVAHRSHSDFHDDFGFRTPPLRNVALTAPYMHNGIYTSLAQVIVHKNDATKALYSYDTTLLRPEFRPAAFHGEESFAQVEETLDVMFKRPLGLEYNEILDLVAFLEALTSPQARDLSHTRPERVPSGLPITIPPDPNLASPHGYALDLDHETYCRERAARAAP